MSLRRGVKNLSIIFHLCCLPRTTCKAQVYCAKHTCAKCKQSYTEMFFFLKSPKAKKRPGSCQPGLDDDFLSQRTQRISKAHSPRVCRGCVQCFHVLSTIKVVFCQFFRTDNLNNRLTQQGQ